MIYKTALNFLRIETAVWISTRLSFNQEKASSHPKYFKVTINKKGTNTKVFQKLTILESLTFRISKKIETMLFQVIKIVEMI